VLTFYCPACWQTIAGIEDHCPACGFELALDKALTFEEKLLDSEFNDIYALREALAALSKIQGSRSRELLQKATGHPFPLIHQLAERFLGNRHAE